MKKITTLFLSLGLLVFSSCEKDLTQVPISSGSVPTFYKNPDDYNQALVSVYAALRFSQAGGYPDRLYNLSETRSDNLYAVSDIPGVRDWEPINNFATTLASNSYIAEAWTTNYASIFRANSFLDKLATNGGIVDADTQKRYEAEAKFLRAFFYFDLVRYFGKVPVIDKPLGAAEASQVPRSPVADVYKLIIADLQTAVANLPVSYTGSTNVFRATSGAAKTLLALVYMTRSGPTYGVEGPGLATNEYAQAATLLNEVIASNKYSLLPKYSDIFSYTNENNAEVIFDVQYVSGGQNLGATYPGQIVSDDLFTALKIPYSSGSPDARFASNNLVSSYPAGDLRKAFNFTLSYTSITGFNETRPTITKYLNPSLRGVNRFDWPINFIVFRYTDVLMMRAECILHGAGGTQAQVDAIVNQVRARAGLTGTVTNVTLPQLMEERRREFAGEGTRWHDLVREGMAITTVNAWSAIDDVKHRMSQATPNNIIYPVPQTELTVVPGLYEQNPGY
ncbi:RagB/SusD family nutrient uptake outer membrane protein [Hymenobacter jejuensis]|uniref:RagB/SusD family nutrient uptake outer membrane protein n=1 Tax=Hymenobacter jejuensis TaxID=2502781 RepID=A0A5B8A2K4_9BACT|nr:RagB/SusD family nutrient uptake outer membrane protein [Hymenobacter jejuensis]QDA61634.1 RagB/SusD family nutrient uptake outer membrane protein [Hymenobacter jejuensis]